MRPLARTRPGAVRLAAIVPVLASLSIVGSASRLGLRGGCAQASTAHHAALVVEHSAGGGHGAGPVITVCVAFTEDSITGAQLLDRSGVQYGSGYSGQAVCQVDHEPAQYPPSCLTASAPYWAMFVSRGGGSWVYSSTGFSSQTFRDGDAEGFRYEGQGDKTCPPAPGGVCPASSTPAPHRQKRPPLLRERRRRPASRPVTRLPRPRRPGRSGGGRLRGRRPSNTPTPALTAIAGSNGATALRPAGIGVWGAAALGALLLAGVRRPARAHAAPVGAATAAVIHPRALAAWSAAALVVVLTSTNPAYRGLVLLLALNVLLGLRRPDAALRPLFIAVGVASVLAVLLNVVLSHTGVHTIVVLPASFPASAAPSRSSR